MIPFLASRTTVSPDECWLWQLSRNGKGYAQGRPPGSTRTTLIHRWVYEQANGPIPTGLTVDHLCRVRNCVNPDHLEAVTNRENIFRSPYAVAVINAAKTHCKRNHPFDEANTRIDKRGCRQCRQCQIDAARDRRARLRSAA